MTDLSRSFCRNTDIWSSFISEEVSNQSHTFFLIQHAVEAYDPYFVQKKDACGIVGLSSLQNISSAFRMLSYGLPADSVDEYVRIGKSTAIESLQKFVKAITAVFGDEYLRSANKLMILLDC